MLAGTACRSLARMRELVRSASSKPDVDYSGTSALLGSLVDHEKAGLPDNAGTGGQEGFNLVIGTDIFPCRLSESAMLTYGLCDRLACNSSCLFLNHHTRLGQLSMLLAPKARVPPAAPFPTFCDCPGCTLGFTLGKCCSMKKSECKHRSSGQCIMHDQKL